jgi:uncharacterized protein (TIGR03437 family)
MRLSTLLMVCAPALLSAQNQSTPYFSSTSISLSSFLRFPFGTLIDFNSDGAPDLVVTQSYGTDPNTPFAPITPRAFQNDGKGNFTEVTSKVFSDLTSGLITPSGHYSVADFNGDGRPDLFIADQGPDIAPLTGGQNRLFFQTPDGRLSDQTGRLLQAKSASEGSCTGDLNGDGAPDLVVPSLGPGAVVFLNDGKGNFANYTAPQPNVGAGSCAIADVNRDGTPDLVIGTTAVKPPGDLDAVVFNDWTGAMTAKPVTLPARPDAASTTSLGLAVADFDGDGWPDIVRATGYSPTSLQFLHNLGDGVYQDESSRIPGSFAGATWPILDVFAADFNGDGWPDFITQGPDTPHLFLNDGTGRFTDASSALPALSGVYVIAVGDLDGNGSPDIIMVTADGSALYLVRNLKPYNPVANPYLPASSGPSISAAGVVHAGSILSRSVAPGEIAVLYGSELGPSTLAEGGLGANGVLQTSVAGASITFDGVPAPLVYSFQPQIAAYIPYEIAGKRFTEVQVTYNGAKSNPILVPVTAAAPGIFTYDPRGIGQAAALNQDNSYNGTSNPAPRGSVVVLFATGEGMTNPAGADGVVYVNSLPGPVLPVSVTIGGQPATIAYAGRAPGSAGLMQLNVYVPAGIPPGAAAVMMSVGASLSRSGVTISVQ